MIIETIHSDRMKDHLIAQFADKPVIYAELDALGAELDLLRQAFTDLREKRWIDTGEGMQLNGIGTIVDRLTTQYKSSSLAFKNRTIRRLSA